MHTASQICEAVGVRSPIGLRARQYDPRARLTDFTAKRIASLGRVRSASHAHRPESDRTLDSHGLTDRPLTRKSCDLSESPIGLTDLRVRSASHGLTDLRVRSASPQLAGRESPILGPIRLLRPGRGATGPRIRLSRPASRGRPIGLSNL